MMEWIMLALLVVVLVLVLVLVVIMGRLAAVVMGFLGSGEQESSGGLPNIDFERVLAKLMMDGGTQLLNEAKAEKGGLLGHVKNLFNPKDQKQLTDKLDSVAGVEPGKLLIDQTRPAPNMMDVLTGQIQAPGPAPGEK